MRLFFALALMFAAGAAAVAADCPCKCPCADGKACTCPKCQCPNCPGQAVGSPPGKGYEWVNLPGIGWGWACPKTVEIYRAGKFKAPACPDGKCPNLRNPAIPSAPPRVIYGGVNPFVIPGACRT